MLPLILKFFLSIFLTIIAVAVIGVAISWLLIFSAFVCRILGLTYLATLLRDLQYKYIAHIKSSITFLFKRK